VNYADYLAQQPQEPQEPQEEPQAQANRLDMMRAQLDAEKLYTLQAEARQAVTDATEPDTLAASLTALIFGEDSTEAGAVAAMIEARRRPGGYELAIEAARQRRALLKKQLDKLAEQEKEIAAQMGLAAADERELMAEQTAAEQANGALLACMDFARQLAADADPGAIIEQAGSLYEKHSGSRAAMGLLLGSLTEWQGRAFTFTGGATLDLVQQQELQELKSRLAAAAGQ
jgi:hypothetical protein